MIENYVNDFILKYDFTNENWSVNDIKQGIKNIIGETPAVKVNYKKDLMVNEVKGTAEEIKKIENIEIIFTGTDNNIKRVTFDIEI